MKEKIIKTQKQLDALKEVKINEKVIIKAELKLSRIIDVYGKLIIDKKLLTYWNNYFRARGSSHVEAWGSSHVEARDSSHVKARGYSHVKAR